MSAAPKLLTQAEVCSRLGIGIDALRAMCAEHPPDDPPPRVDLGSGSRPAWRWYEGRLDAWVARRSAWRRSRGTGEHGPSAGPTALESTAGSAPTKRRRKSSGATSSEPTPSAGDGNLRRFALRLASEK